MSDDTSQTESLLFDCNLETDKLLIVCLVYFDWMKAEDDAHIMCIKGMIVCLKFIFQLLGFDQILETDRHQRLSELLRCIWR